MEGYRSHPTGGSGFTICTFMTSGIPSPPGNGRKGDKRDFDYIEVVVRRTITVSLNCDART